MKRILIIVVSLLLLFSMSSAAAFLWGDSITEDCNKYEIVLTKYEKLESDLGIAFKENPDLAAKKTDTVYYTIDVTNKNGEPVDFADIEFHDLVRTGAEGELETASVTGNNPYIKVNITEKTPIDELFYKGKSIIVEDASVQIGKCTFVREDNQVTDILFDGNALEMCDSLAELGITLEAIYGGQICMSDDALIKNFGQICESEEIVYWKSSIIQPDSNLIIPKTGDTSILLYAAVAVVLSIICIKVRSELKV